MRFRSSFILLATVVADVAHASSEANDTVVYSKWEPEPRGRGTMGILLSCIITLSICVWTSIHLNVVTDPTPSRMFLMKFGWMLAGIFTPEVTLYIAFRQLVDAKMLLREINEIKVRLSIYVVIGR